jgi:hypothetical protein
MNDAVELELASLVPKEFVGAAKFGTEKKCACLRP